jgi:hypothetical protein
MWYQYKFTTWLKLEQLPIVRVDEDMKLGLLALTIGNITQTAMEELGTFYECENTHV